MSENILDKIIRNKVKKIDPELLAFGQARLLINSTDTEEDKGCKYCGYCMSGCVYDCIYKSSAELDKLVAVAEREAERQPRLGERLGQVAVPHRQPVARRHAEAALDDLDPEPVAELAALGAHPAQTPRGVGENAELVGVCAIRPR